MQRRVKDIMITLKKIKREGNIISADYYIEDDSGRGYVEVDFTTEKIIFLQAPPGWENYSCASHAKRELLRIAKSDTIPEERTVLWY